MAASLTLDAIPAPGQVEGADDIPITGTRRDDARASPSREGAIVSPRDSQAAAPTAQPAGETMSAAGVLPPVLAQQGSVPIQDYAPALAGRIEKAAPATRLDAAQDATSPAKPLHQIDLQLHPAELGAVRARLKTSGQRLSVEIAAETATAHQRLTEQADSIAGALEALGFTVEQVTIRPPAATAAEPRGAMAPDMAAGRGAGGGDEAHGGRRAMREREDSSVETLRLGSEPGHSAAGGNGGLYI